ncbi:uncharacterized protein SCHCODRAFT_02626084 [Schizophyllum commune H4-8]|uniref:uncharacterized protein n=1 Tax=Schizophyllum commune (strain H4-8 / FGSC 9210) TaxID=578458 RepID=UPI00215EF7A1|nr:uncharacterized protein SCHCODRAFT_02626084 [Schizophyllum commune H4-8]KAI5892404.1 hypothetical protein SCHCODRAFT_02626084 [Schizophyllum commune H4-8]
MSLCIVVFTTTAVYYVICAPWPFQYGVSLRIVLQHSLVHLAMDVRGGNKGYDPAANKNVSSSSVCSRGVLS